MGTENVSVNTEINSHDYRVVKESILKTKHNNNNLEKIILVTI